MKKLEEKRFYVYVWYKKDSNEVFYVGKGTGKRKDDKTPDRRNKYFMNVVDKYECSNRIIEEKLTNEEACDREKYWIKHYWDKNQAYCNFTDGGEGFATGSLNPIHKRDKSTLADGLLKYMNSPDYVNPFSYTIFKGEDNHFYGKKHTEETKRKISESRKGKGGQSGKDNPMYGSDRSGENNPMYGVTGKNHPNATMYLVKYKSGAEEEMTYKQCERKFGIGFSRIDKTGGIIHYKKKCKRKDLYEGVVIEYIGKC